MRRLKPPHQPVTRLPETSANTAERSDGPAIGLQCLTARIVVDTQNQSALLAALLYIYICAMKQDAAPPSSNCPKVEAQLEKVIPNSGWYKLVPGSNTVFVFIHGLGSTSASCWMSQNNIFWPDLVAEDTRFGGSSVFMGGYYTSAKSLDYKAEDCAKEVLQALSISDSQNNPAPLTFRNLVFVCHSMGGIVARDLLYRYRDKFTDKAIGLVLIASPSRGSPYATFLKLLTFVLGNDAVANLEPNSEMLADLDRRFRELIHQRLIPNLIGEEAVEHFGPVQRFLMWRFLPRVVRIESASVYFGSPTIIAGSDHSTIVKPTGPDHLSHKFLVDFYKSKFCSNAIGVTPSSPATITPACSLPVANHNLRHVLFDIYDTTSAAYYLTRGIDTQLDSAVQFTSCWVWGASGSGKTSAIRRRLLKEKIRPIEVCLASLHGEISRGTLVREIAATAYQIYTPGAAGLDLSYPSLVKVLAAHSQHSPIALYLDEAPIAYDGYADIATLTSLVANLLTSVKQVSANADLRFVVSSIAEPKMHTTANAGQLAERLQVIEAPLWPEVDLGRLLDLLLPFLPDVAIDRALRTELLHRANGSPRFLKTFLRLVVANPTEHYGAVLAKTANQIVV